MDKLETADQEQHLLRCGGVELSLHQPSRHSIATRPLTIIRICALNYYSKQHIDVEHQHSDHMATLMALARKHVVEEMRITVLGAGNVGKRCMARRYCADPFFIEYDPTDGGYGYQKECVISGIKCVLTIDTFHTSYLSSESQLAHHVAQQSDALIFAYSGIYPMSIDRASSLKETLQPHIPGATFPPIAVVVTRSDCAEFNERGLAPGRELAINLGVPFFVTSAITGAGVTEVMEYLAKEVLQSRGVLESEATAESRSAGGSKKRSKMCCFV
ncbi:hypothetical protein G7Z17_g7958 [Cylindrodendrum hubeiense]|uniref:Uncharacterized protein n=1 Tax=Cylindrodendrum hubeiense TaxID=595255 RepID=A0A9P5H222_9HYPO|nr:hypothetical protein G7Z17_g7958 [Cylindrodendrum hubeiense]